MRIESDREGRESEQANELQDHENVSISFRLFFPHLNCQCYCWHAIDDLWRFVTERYCKKFLWKFT